MVTTLLREPARPAAIREHPLAPWFAVAAVCFGAFMGQLDASIVTVAFPALQRQFGTGLAAVQWVSLGYLLALTALLVPAGRWSDRVGRKLIYLYGFVVFAGASAGCGLAPSLAVLIALRVVQAAARRCCRRTAWRLWSPACPRGPAGRRSACRRRRRPSAGVRPGDRRPARRGGGLALGVLPQRPGRLLAVVAGVYLLPDPRTAAQPGRRQPAGRGRSAAPTRAVRSCSPPSATAGMLAISALSGLGAPVWPAAGSPCLPCSPGPALLSHERRAAAPMLDLRGLTAAAPARAARRALCLPGPVRPAGAVPAGHLR